VLLSPKTVARAETEREIRLHFQIVGPWQFRATVREPTIHLTPTLISDTKPPIERAKYKFFRHSRKPRTPKGLEGRGVSLRNAAKATIKGSGCEMARGESPVCRAPRLGHSALPSGRAVTPESRWPFRAIGP